MPETESVPNQKGRPLSHAELTTLMQTEASWVPPCAPEAPIQEPDLETDLLWRDVDFNMAEARAANHPNIKPKWLRPFFRKPTRVNRLLMHIITIMSEGLRERDRRYAILESQVANLHGEIRELREDLHRAEKKRAATATSDASSSSDTSA